MVTLDEKYIKLNAGEIKRVCEITFVDVSSKIIKMFSLSYCQFRQQRVIFSFNN